MPQQIDTIVFVLASLLRHIGRFAVRAGQYESDIRQAEGAAGQAHDPEDVKHRCARRSAYFIEKELLVPHELEPQRAQIAQLALAHDGQGGSDALAQVIARADELAAGMDRVCQHDEAPDGVKARLLSVFSQVKLFEVSDVPQKYYPLKAIEKDPFPVSLPEARQTDYGELWGQFVKKVKVLPCNMGLAHYLSSLVALLERFTWCIPLSSAQESDISLYDHAMTTAAIAQALAVYHQHHGGVPGEAQQPKFLLLGGDLSGIQSYIFSIEKSHSAGVAKLLRARSFHLQVLTHSVILSFLSCFGLWPVARIMDAGGRFILLLPNLESVRQQACAFAAEVQAWFFHTFKGRLSLNLSYEKTLCEADFDGAVFHTRLDEFFDELELQKTKKFSRLFEAGQSPVIGVGPGGDDFTEGACAICQIQPVSRKAMARYEKVYKKEEVYKKTVRLCESCEMQIDRIGKALPEKVYAVFARTATDNSIELFDNLHLRLVDNVTADDREAVDILNLGGRDRYRHHAIAGNLPRFAQGDKDRWRHEKRQDDEDDEVCDGAPKTFTHLAQEARIYDKDTETLRGKAFLAAFKADVDNLGLLFSVGFGNRLSLSRFAGLSRMLNHFFAEHMVSMIKKENSKFSDMYVVFAGGDDLFLLGPWCQLMDFAKEINVELRRYVANNPDITMSAGIYVAKPALPVHTIARNAEQLLEDSKRFCRNPKAGGRTKDAVTVFGVTVPWEDYAELMKKGRWLERLALNDLVPQGMLMRLLGYAKDCEAFLSGQDTGGAGQRTGLYRSRMLYDFARNLPRLGDNDHSASNTDMRLSENSEENIPKLSNEDNKKLRALGTDPLALPPMRLAISYALYRLRKE